MWRRGEIINHIISEYSKLAQKEFQTRWVRWSIGKYCKKFKFVNTNKRYMHNLASLLENEMHKLLWDFEIQTDHLFLDKRPDLETTNKRKGHFRIVNFAILADYSIKLKESKRKQKEVWVPGHCYGIEKRCNMKVRIIPSLIGALGTVTEWLIKDWRDWK